jgi:YVTN family beta-propeller protein
MNVKIHVNVRCLVVLAGLAVGLRPMAVVAAPFAYVTDRINNTVAVIDVASATVVATIPVPVGPSATAPGDSFPSHVAITPDGAYAYVTLTGAAGLNSVGVISTALALTDPTNAVVATVPVGANPYGLAITPDGAHAYVANAGSNNVSVIDTALALTNPTNAVVATVFVAAGSAPYGVAISPDGRHAWVTEPVRHAVGVIDTALALTNPAAAEVAEVSLTQPFWATPFAVAVSPDGAVAWVSSGVGLLYRIDTATALINPASSYVSHWWGGSGSNLYGVAVTGAHVYVADATANLVLVVNPTGPDNLGRIPVGAVPFGVAVTQDGTVAYVTNTNDSTVSVINLALNAVVGAPIPIGPGAAPFGVAITPGLSAVARMGVAALAGVSVDLTMTVAEPARVRSVAWDLYGNGTLVQTTSTLTTHFTYPMPGAFTLRATVIFSDGSTSSSAIPLRIQSPVQAISTVSTLVKLLTALDAVQQYSLVRTLGWASGALQLGQVTSVCDQIGAVSNELNVLVQGGYLNRASAAPALGEVAAARLALRCR